MFQGAHPARAEAAADGAAGELRGGEAAAGERRARPRREVRRRQRQAATDRQPVSHAARRHTRST